MSDLWIPSRLPTKFLSRSHVARRDRMRWNNNSGEIVPPFGVVQLSSYDTGNQEFLIQKPDGGPAVFPNGPVRVQSSKRGGSPVWNVPRPVLLDSQDYSCGDEVGPVADQWYMSSEGSGFFVFKEPNTDNVATVDRTGGSAVFAHAEVIACFGGGYYELRIASHTWDVPESSYALGCDPCELLTECGVADDPDREVMTGDGDSVIGYDPRKIPLESPGHVIIAKTGQTVPDSLADYDYGGPSPLWFILTGTYPLQKIKDQYWECCEDEYGNQSVQLIRCDTYFVEGAKCTGETTPCP